MPDKITVDEHPLLEIEIIQLSNLFGNSPHQATASTAHALLATDCSPEQAKALASLDIYRIPQDAQSEVFIQAAYLAFLNREPSKAELAGHLDALESAKEDFDSIIASLTMSRDNHIRQYNENREKSLHMTVKDIDRWSSTKKSWWRK